MTQTETKTQATTYRRVTIPKAGSYDKLQFEELPALTPAAGEVVIDVKATGVNYADCVVRMGLYASAKEYVGWPITPGFEVAGTVAALGPEVSSDGAGLASSEARGVRGERSSPSKRSLGGPWGAEPPRNHTQVGGPALAGPPGGTACAI